jgi:hypothetical protein
MIARMSLNVLTDRGPLPRLALFAAAVAVVSAGAATLGIAIGDRVRPESRAGSNAHGGEPGSAAGMAVVSHGDYVALFGTTTFSRGRSEQLTVQILGGDGQPVTEMEEHGGVRLHLIIVRSDLTGYQHLHPTLSGGTWQTDVELPAAGTYRAYADFEHEGEKIVLGSDLLVPGDFDPLPLPAPTRTANVDGYDVAFDRDVHAGEESELVFRLARNGVAPDVEPYLGERGHLVALREGDAAYLHVHPLDEGATGEIRFMTTFPTAGNYRLFLQFEDEGRVHTVPFTLEVPR